MAVDLNKIRAEAPHLVDPYKYARNFMLNEGLDPSICKSSVVAAFDLSRSTEMRPNHLYSDGTMQDVGDLSLAAGFAFDDDGKVPVAFFHSHIIDLGEVTPAISQGCLGVWRNYRMGGTSYIAAIRWMLSKARFSINDSEIEEWAYALKRQDFSRVEPLSVKGTAQYPTYGLLATDGEPQDDPWKLLAAIYLASQYPLYIECVGVGAQKRFETLEKFDTLPTQAGGDRFGRFVDNVGTFDTKLASGNQHRMLEMMLSEYSSYYTVSRALGLITIF